MVLKNFEDLERVRQECKAMVTKRAFASGAVGAVPVPGVDAVVDGGMLVQLLPAISRRFGLDASQIDELDEQGKQQITLLLTNLGKNFVGKRITQQLIAAALKRVGISIAAKNVAKFVPLIGTGVAATIGFLGMKYVGNQHVDDCYDVAKRLLQERIGSTQSEPAPATS